MTTLEEIEKAVTKLTPEQIAKFRAWFEEFQERAFDEQIERDVEAAAKFGRVICREAPGLAAMRQRVVPAGALVPRRSVSLLPALRRLGRGGEGVRESRARRARSRGRGSAIGVGLEAPPPGRNGAG